jgi:peptidoglycan/xylan/chitin deacetylase (PgdA/CDA1 family)
MPEIKPLFFRLSTPLSSFLTLPFLRRLSGVNLIVPLYHTVNDEAPAHIRYLYSIKNVGTFRQDLETLLKYYMPVGLQELIEITDKPGKLKKSVFHLTFDDGLSEFYSVIAPILKEMEIPATCFLNNAFIDNTNLFFRFKESLLIDRLHHLPAGSNEWKRFHSWSKSHGLENGYYRKIILGIDYTSKHLLDELASELSVDFDDYLKKIKPYLQTFEIEELIRDGFTFGAHSSDHIDYQNIGEEEQIIQTRDSVNDIVNRFRLNYRVFSFPFTDFGISRSFYDRINDTQVASMTFGCAGIKSSAKAVSQQRIPVETYKGSLKTALKKEYLYHLFLKAFGKG